MPTKILILAMMITTSFSALAGFLVGEIVKYPHPICGALAKKVANLGDGRLALSIIGPNYYKDLGITEDQQQEILQVAIAMEAESGDEKEAAAKMEGKCHYALRKQAEAGIKKGSWAKSTAGGSVKNVDTKNIVNQQTFVEQANDKRESKATSLHCDLQLFNISCNPMFSNIGFPTPLRDLMAATGVKDETEVPNGLSPENCECLDTKWQAANQTKSLAEFNQEAAELSEEFASKVLKAGSLKFINDFASLTEDAEYFAVVEAKVLTYNKKTLEEGLCQDPDAFQKKVDALCSTSGMMDGRAERMSKILNTLNPGKNTEPFAAGLKGLVTDIQNLPLDSAKVKIPGGRKNYTRLEWDNARNTFLREKPEVQIVNTMITEMMNDKKMRAVFEKHLFEGKTPAYAVFDILTNNGNITKNLLDNVHSSRKKMDDPVFAALYSSFGKDKDYQENLNSLLSSATTFSPGIKNLLLDSDLFQKTVKYYKSTNGSSGGLLGAMMIQKRGLNEHFVRRCEKVQDNLAELVCTKTDDLKKRLSPVEMNELVLRDPFPKGTDSLVSDKALCQLNAETTVYTSAFSGLEIVKGSMKNSDYVSTKKLIPEGKESSFEKMAYQVANDRDLADKMSKAEARNSYTKSSEGKFAEATQDARQYSIFRNESSSHDKNAQNQHLSNTNGVIANLHTETVLDKPSSSDHPNTKSFLQEAQVMAPAFIAPTTTVAPAAAVANSVDEIKEEEARISRERLARELSSTENKTRVKNHLSEISESDAQEILRLRDQAIKDRDTISDMRLEQERAKTEALRSEYEQLKTRLENLEKPAPVAAAVAAAPQVSTGGSTSSFSSSFSESGVPHFETSTLAAPTTTAGMNSGRATGDTKSGFAAASLGESGAGGSNAVGNGAGAGREIASESRGTMNLIVSSSTGSDGKTQVAEDPNKVLINYLTKNEPSIQQLQDLKNSGLLYTEEDVTKEGKKIQTKKVIKYSELSPEAKSLVERKLAIVKLQEVKRNYSRQALMLELFTVSLKKSNLNVKKSGPLKL